ncbi:MAG: carbon-nitrogen hydrolase family protein [Tenericutes bacterium]|nr:carbon-nitrogen hydrolase family protein [Mycoplasmatota bacterium]
MKVLIIQNSVKETVKENMNHIQELLSTKTDEQYDFIILPEMFMTPYELNYFQINQQNQNSDVIQQLKGIAKQFNSYLIAGSIPETENGNIYNTSFIFNRKGELITKYQKIHLFSVIYPDGKKFSESDCLSPGNNIVSFNTEFGKMGVMICFDIRFPYLAKKIRDLNTKVIFVPAAFNNYTGPLHWHTTFKARAIDNQMYFVSASPARESFGEYQPYGHSLVVDPYGKIINELSEHEDSMTVDIDLNLIKEARESIPIIKNEVDVNDFDVKQ